MKLTALIAGLALAVSVAATPIGYIVNNAGGQIIFTSQVCEVNGNRFDRLRRVFSFDRMGGVTEGCYYLDTKTDLLMVRWSDDASRSVFRLEHVRMFPE